MAAVCPTGPVPDETRPRLAAEMAALTVRDDLGDGHRLPGRRMPDPDIDMAEGPLIRPNDHAAWVSDGSVPGLSEVLHRWCGEPAATC